MIAGYDRVFPSGYAAAISVELSDSAIEQIRKLVNLLMVFSMLLSMISPIYAPMGFALPSYAFFDGSSAPAAQPVTAQPARTRAGRTAARRARGAGCHPGCNTAAAGLWRWRRCGRSAGAGMAGRSSCAANCAAANCGRCRSVGNSIDPVLAGRAAVVGARAVGRTLVARPRSRDTARRRPPRPGARGRRRCHWRRSQRTGGECTVAAGDRTDAAGTGQRACPGVAGRSDSGPGGWRPAQRIAPAQLGAPCLCRRHLRRQSRV
jgi:hypothetical protein